MVNAVDKSTRGIGGKGGIGGNTILDLFTRSAKFVNFKKFNSNHLS